MTSVAGNLDPVLLQASDLPAGMTLRPSQMQLLHAGDTPGLQASGSGDLRAALSDDHNQFLIVIAVVPDTGGVKSLTDAFTLANYLPTLAPNAKDATGAATTVSGAPPGASAFSYGGTVTGPAGQSQRVDGQVLAFAEGNVFLLLNYGSYAAAAPPIDLGALATTIAQRVASASSGA